MEPRFSAQTSLNKPMFYEYSHVVLRKNKLFLVMPIFACAMLASYVALLFFSNSAATTSILTAGILFLMYWLMFDRIMGATSYRNMNKKTVGIPIVYWFGDEGYHVQSEIENSSLKYDSIMDIAETPNLYILFIHKSAAHLIAKSSFYQGESEDFRAFISERTGKPIKFINYKKRSIAIPIVTVIVVFALMLAATVGIKTYRNREVPYTSQGYSVTLPSQFIQDSDKGYIFCAYTKEAYVLTICETPDDLLYEYGLNAPSAADYAEWLRDNLMGIRSASIQHLDNGTVCLAYLYTEDDDTFYQCDAVTVSADGNYWTTSFVCNANDQKTYAAKFFDWAKSINTP